MSILTVLAQSAPNPDAALAGLIVLAAFGLAIMLLVLMGLAKRFLYICRPNQVLVFSGRKYLLEDGTTVGSREVFGGRAWRRPIIERVDSMSLETIPLQIKVTNAYSKGGIPLAVDAIGNVKISSHPTAIKNAVERFLGRGLDEVKRVAKETLEGNLRAVLATLTPEEINEDRLKFAESLSREAEDDLRKLGLQLDTLKIQHVADERQYLESIGRKRIAHIIRDAEIAESSAKREATQQAADAQSAGDVARENAHKVILQKQNELRRVKAELLALAEAEEKRAIAAGQAARAQAEQELQTVRAELVGLERQADEVIPAEAERTALELVAKGEVAAIAENGRASAEALRLLAEAWGRAGIQAREVFLIQRIEDLMRQVVDVLRQVKVGELRLVDSGDGRTLPNVVASYPAMVTAVLEALRASTGVDIPGLLVGSTPDPGARSA